MRTLLIGAGRSGVGAARLLSTQDMSLTLVNENIFPEMKELNDLGINVKIKKFPTIQTEDYDLVIKAPGVPGYPEAINEIEIASKIAKDYKLYAISGTNGKTTTIKLLHSMLLKVDKNSLALGNVGYSMSQAVLDHGISTRNIALELSSFQIEGLKNTELEAYGLLNLSADHLDRYSSAKEYFEVKLKMLKHSKYKIINIDDSIITSMIDSSLDYITLSLKGDANVSVKNKVVYIDNTKLFDVNDLIVPGEHNLMNAMFASTLAYLAGVKVVNIQEALREFKGVEHRLEYVKEINGTRYYNDSKATNPEATEVCLKSFNQNIQLIAGGYDKKISFQLLAKYNDQIENIYVFGESAHLLKDIFPNAKVFNTMLQATKAAHEEAKAGDVVILSPACASFDQFENFEERGNIFKDYIKTL